MRLHTYKIFKSSLAVAILVLQFACNKEIPQPVPIETPAPSGSSIAETVNTDPNLTILKAAITRAGTSINALLSDKSAVYTFFAPTNSAFQAIGIPNEAAVAAPLL